MDKGKLIKALSKLICEIVEKDEEVIEKLFEVGKMRFRQYDRLDTDENKLEVIDFTIEF